MVTGRFSWVFYKGLNLFCQIKVMLNHTLKALPAKGCWALVVLVAATAKRKEFPFLVISVINCPWVGLPCVSVTREIGLTAGEQC